MKTTGLAALLVVATAGPAWPQAEPSGASGEAEITALAKDVDQQPYPEPWMPAQVGTRLEKRDGVRTRAQSSAELTFEGGSRLRLGELSVVFLRAPGPRVAGVRLTSLELREGQADLEMPTETATPAEVEILVEGARVRARPDPNQTSLLRVRRDSEVATQVMVFGGEAEVEADGATVAVTAGMGTTVTKDGKPSPPERLLPAPKPWRPIAGARLDHANPKLSWDPVDDAASYTVDVCRDEACGEIVFHLARTDEPQAIPEILPLADLYWRVCAVSRSGLDGLASLPRAMSVRSLWRKPHPPRRRVVSATGPGS